MKKSKIFTALVSVALSLTMLFPLVGCGEKELTASDISYFTTWSTYKVKQDEMPPEKEILSAESLEITMVQGEYEILQLIMNSKKDVDWFNASISDLVNVENPNIVYKSENVTVAKQSYLYIGQMGARAIVWADHGYTAGFYPDALIPMNAVLNFDLNNFKAGDNQGLTFQFSTRPELDENDDAILKEGITEEQAKTLTDSQKYTYNPVGTYVGTITLDFKTFTKQIPVTLNIADATVSEKSTATASFGCRNNKFNAELDYTQRASDLWNRAMLKYRYTACRMWTETGSGQQQRDLKISVFRDVLSHERAATVNTQGSVGVFDNNYPDDEEWHAKYSDLKGIQATCLTSHYQTEFDDWVRFSIEDNENYFSRLILDCAPDEPAANGKFLETKAAAVSVDKLIEEYVKILESNEGTDFRGNLRSNYKIEYETKHPESGKSWETFKQEMIESIKVLQMPVATAWSESYARYVKCFSPTYGNYASEGQRAKYKDNYLQWWYAFVHDIEGNSLPERMLGWMQAEYNVRAQSDWSVDYFADKETGGKMIDDFYFSYYTRTNYGSGDGWYFYPAAQLELDELVPTFRIQAKVDAMEEYELFYSLKQTYAEIAEELGIEIDPTDVISGLGKNIYNGITCVMDCGNFEATRLALINLIKCTQSEAKMCIVSVDDNGFGKVKYQIYLKANADNTARTLKNNGEIVQPNGAMVGGGYLYDIVIDRTQSAENDIELEFEAGGETLVYSQGVGGKVTIVEAEEITAGSNSIFKDGAAEVDYDLVGTIEKLEAEQGTQDIEINVYGADADDYVNIKVQSPKINSLFNAKTISMTFHFYNPSDKAFNITALGVMSGKNDAKELFKATIQPGYNSIEVNTKGNDWNKYPLQHMIWKFEEDGSEMYRNVTFYFKDIVVYEG